MSDTLTSYRTVTPYLVVPDGGREIQFLEAAFGATTLSCERRPDGTVMHSEIRIGDSLVMLGQTTEEWKALKASLYLWVENVDEVYAKALAAGATSLSTPEDKPYGHRNAGVADPAGITWWIGSPVK